MKNLSTTLACHARFFYLIFDHIRKITGKSLTFFVTCSILSRNSWFDLSEHCSQMIIQRSLFSLTKKLKTKKIPYKLIYMESQAKTSQDHACYRWLEKFCSLPTCEKTDWKEIQQALYRVLHSVTIQYNTRIKYLPVTSSDSSDGYLLPLCCIPV